MTELQATETLPPFVGSLPSQWDARYSGDGAARPNSRVSDPLTARERDVLAMISQGCSNKRMARTFGDLADNHATPHSGDRPPDPHSGDRPPDEAAPKYL